MELTIQTVFATVLLGLVLTATVTDIRSRRIPNFLTLGGALFGIVFQITFNGLDGLLAALGGWAVGFAFMIPGYALRQTGAGDVKLMAAVGTFLGPASTVIAAASGIFIGAVVALFIAFVGRGVSPWRRYGGMLSCLLVTGKAVYVAPQAGELMAKKFPYAFAIAAGTLVALWRSSLPGLVAAWSQYG